MSEINHPKHYNSHPSGIECIQIARHHNFNIGNVLKYIWRAGLKDSESDIKDLKKAMWYLQDEIEKLKSNQPTITKIIKQKLQKLLYK